MFKRVPGISRLLLGATAALSLQGAAVFAEESGTEFFEKKIRPLLVENCYSCHSESAEKVKGGLKLDSREAILAGGELGPAAIPGSPEKSLLIKAVHYKDPDLQMPPKEKKLFSRQIADLEQWVKIGLPWPESAPGENRKAASSSEQAKATEISWAFLPVQKPSIPALKPGQQAANPIDHFLLARLAESGIEPNPPATKLELIRRVYFDLIGLPPTPEAVAAFEGDNSAAAWPRLIDELLAMPEYGERWGRHWLDVVRFAQTNGYERDGEKPFAWRYRDYVIRSFNQDKPYNRFVMEQIAGDELPDGDQDSLIATAFQRLNVWDDEPDDKRLAEFDELDDIISTTGSAFMGLTISCARCHDHKFDPISAKDYYQMLAFFRNVRPYENPKYSLDSANFAPLADPVHAREWGQSQAERVAALKKELESTKDEELKQVLTAELKAAESENPFEWTLAVRERSNNIPTHVLIRGNPATPGAEVQAAFPEVFGGKTVGPRKVREGVLSSGRRLQFAEWLANGNHPLTARVMVNRVWKHHFGRGIVSTTTDFGKAGVPPTHPELLDWLSIHFVENGWSLKKLHKTILLSQAYRMSSANANEAAVAKDPDNKLLWRQNFRRLEAEAIRDSVLQVSGTLKKSMGGRGFFPQLGADVLAGASRPGAGWTYSNMEDTTRRSVYIYLARTMQVPMLEAFDFNNITSPLGERPNTTVAPQALLMLNDDFMQKQAERLADRLLREAGSESEAQVVRAYQLAFGRKPSDREISASLEFLQRQEQWFAGLHDRLTFKPLIPISLATEYLDSLKPENFMSGPGSGWSYFGGKWGEAYGGIRSVDRERTPFALWNESDLKEGTIKGKVVFDKATEFAAILFKASAKDNQQRGYELHLDPKENKVQVVRYTDQVTVLAEASTSLPYGSGIPFHIFIHGNKIEISLQGEKVLEVVEKELLDGSKVGVRTWGSLTSIDGLKLNSPAGEKRYVAQVEPGPVTADKKKALTSFCLMVMNLNEMVYID